MVAVVALIDGRPGAYGISFPDFPGAVAGGASVDDTLRRGREGLAFQIESMAEVGEALPRVRDISEIRADPEFAEEFAGAAMVALVDVDLPGRAVRLNILALEGPSRRCQRRNLLDLLRQLALRPGKIVALLQGKPQVGAIAAQLADAHRHGRRDRLVLREDVVERLARYAQELGDLRLRALERRQDVLPQQFARVHRIEAAQELVRHQ
jgi:predicted RNase H-like HicB family nuclease